MAQGELLVGTRPSGYVLAGNGGSTVYGVFESEQDANDAQAELGSLVAPDAKAIPVLRAMRQGRRGRKSDAEKAADAAANGKQSAPASNAPKATPATGQTSAKV